MAITRKETVRGSNFFAASAMQGYRPEMEDAQICEPRLTDSAHSLFCVLDGHGGTSASEFASTELTRILTDCEEWETYLDLVAPYVSKKKSSEGEPSNKVLKEMEQLLELAMIRSFVELDRELFFSDNTVNQDGSSPGSTAVAILITPFQVVCTNLGDSRCVLASSGTSAPTSVTAFALSEDHKPDTEKQRIQQAGGIVQDGRVDGQLSVSRALGDFEFKEPYDEDYDPTDRNDVERLI